MTQDRHPIRHPRRREALAAIAAGMLGAADRAVAQSAYPNKPIKLIVGYAPGASVDISARVAGDLLAAQLGATVIVENQPGAAGALAAQRVVSSPADGYTLLSGSTNEIIATALINPKQKYDPHKDFTPIGLIGTAPVLLVASPKTNVKTLAEFIDVVKRNPGKYSYGTSGIGSILHFAGELLKQRAGLFMVHIPYRDTASRVSDLVSGTLDFAILSEAAAAQFVQNGRMVALGITSAARSPTMPSVPAFAEHPLLKGYNLAGWYALMGPRGLPPEVTARLNAALQAGLKEPAFRKRVEDSGATPSTGAEDLAKLMRDDSVKYAELVKYAKMRE